MYDFCRLNFHPDPIPEWRKRGYTVEMYFLKLDSPELAIQRVRSRVASGGHGVEDEVIKRRYYRGNRLLEELYKSLVDDWLVIDNSGEEPVLIEEGHNNA